MLIPRRLESIVTQDLQRKMVMIAGPRQCGKTTLAKVIAQRMGWNHRYYNWDVIEDRKKLLHDKVDESKRLWIFDELHKYRRWRNWLKGKYDQHHPNHAFLVTGSAKLAAYSRGGDSLQGRYYLHRLHPLTLSEWLELPVPGSLEEMVHLGNHIPKEAQKALLDLLKYGGFPEPLSSSSEREASRWRLAYNNRLVREEIQSLEHIQDLDRVELLLDRLPITVGSVLSLNSLREDLEVAFETVRHWLSILENIYAVFRVAPFGPPRIKAVKKEQKLYFWDWAKVEEESKRFENLVALHLLRFIHWREDVEGENWELRYFRDVVGHEIDFVVLRNRKPWCCVEVKTREQGLDSGLKYFLERIECPYAFQVSLYGENDWAPPRVRQCSIRILPAVKFLAHLV